VPPGHELRTIPVPDAWVGHAVDALPAASLAGLVVILAIREHDGRVEHVAATPDLVLQDGWRIAVMGTREAIDKLARDGRDGDE
jgi:Trk K+ transport system NAD-binding subunit